MAGIVGEGHLALEAIMFWGGFNDKSLGCI